MSLMGDDAAKVPSVFQLVMAWFPLRSPDWTASDHKWPAQRFRVSTTLEDVKDHVPPRRPSGGLGLRR